LQGITLRLKCDGTRAKNRFRLSAKRTSPFKSAGASVQSAAGSRAVRISGSYAGYTTFRGSVRVLATHTIRQFPLHFPFRASPCAITFQLDSTTYMVTSRRRTRSRSLRFPSLPFKCSPCLYVRSAYEQSCTGILVSCGAVCWYVTVFIVYVMWCEGVRCNEGLGVTGVWQGLRVRSLTTLTLLFKV
jgi:hypothetical protein